MTASFRRILLSALALVLIAGVAPSIAGAPVPAAEAAARPDIITIMIDDLAYIEDQRVLKRLPQIRKLFIQNGLRFRHMYNEDPLCCPARANFLTGQHTLHNGVIKNDGDLLDTSKTIAYALQGSGYHTLMVGKYFNRYGGSKHPPGWDDITMFFRDVERLASLAPQKIAAAPDGKPIFAWLSSSAPHFESGSFQPFVPEADRGAPECQDITRYKPPTYFAPRFPKPFPRNMPYWPKGWKLTKTCESLLAVDRMVGDIVEAQKARGRPAIYVFFSDNGMAWGQKGFPAKRVPPSTRLPFYVSGNGVPNGKRTNSLVSIIDIAPTLVEMAGGQMPWVDGRSFARLLRGQSYAGRRNHLEINPARKFGWAALRKKDWRYIRWDSGKRELYHLRTDRWERWNLIRKRPYLARQMNRQLNRMIKASRR